MLPRNNIQACPYVPAHVLRQHLKRVVSFYKIHASRLFKPKSCMNMVSKYRNPHSLVLVLGFSSKTIAIGLSIANVPLFISLLNVSGYAAYATLSSLVSWVALLNLGLPATLQNSLSRLRNSPTSARKLISYYNSAILLVLLVGLPLAIFASLPIYKLLVAADPRISYITVIASTVCIFVSAIAQLNVGVLYGLHRPFWPNIYPAMSSIVLFVSGIALSRAGINEPNTVIFVVFAGSLLAPLHSYIFSEGYKNLGIRPVVTLSIIRKSRHHLLFAFLASSTLSVDYIIMTLILSPLQVIEYSLTNKVFMTVFVFFNVTMLNKRTVLSDLLHSVNGEKARMYLSRMIAKSLAIIALIGLPLVFAYPVLIGILSQYRLTTTSLWLPITALIYVAIRVWTDSYSMALLCFDQAKKINIIVAAQACLSIFLQIVLGKYFGATGIFIALSISFILTVGWLLPNTMNKLLRAL